MIENERAVIADSLWSATANPAPECPVLIGDQVADMVVVGGGFTGLSAALHLAETGVSVVLLEAEQPGWGASGRNGGQINPGLKEPPEAILARFGPEMGARMIAVSGGAAQLVFDLIARHDIRCDRVHTGWIRAAHSDSSLRDLLDHAAQLRQWGADVAPLDRDEIARLVGSPAYSGGVIDRRGGNLHPLNYALGLAKAAQGAGARLFARSRALELTRTGAFWRVATAQGSVRAGRVLLATNGYTDGLVPGLAQTVVPIRSVQVATAPLSDNLRASILPGLQSLSDQRRLLLYFRLDAQGRFIMGGRGGQGDGSTRRQLDALRQVSAEMFPQLGDVAWDHAWGGNVAITPDHFPHLHAVAPDVLAGLGFNGRGVAMGTALGKVMAQWGRGVAERDLDYPITPMRRMPFHRFHRLGIAFELARAHVLDRLGR